MTWTDPKVWTVGEIVTKATMDAQVKDNLRYLKGIDGVPTIESGLIIGTGLGTEYIKLPLLTTAQIGTALATTTGREGFDSDVGRIKFYDGTAIRAVVSTADVDDVPVNGATTDPISSNWAFDYLNLVTATGDIRYATGTGVETRLPIGTPSQLLQTNASGTAPQWTTILGISLVATSYTGDNVTSRQITTGFPCKYVTLERVSPPRYFWMCLSTANCIEQTGTTIQDSVGVLLHTSNGFVVSSAQANIANDVYNYVAIG